MSNSLQPHESQNARPPCPSPTPRVHWDSCPSSQRCHPAISWVFFLLWLHPFILSGVISPLISSSILGTYWPGEFLFQYPIILPFILFMGFSRQEYWNGLPFPSPVDHILSNLSTMTHPSWVAPRAWLSSIELDEAVVLVWLDWLVFCEYGFSVFALWCPLATPTILLGFLLPWAWGISSWLLQQSAAMLLTLDEGYLLTAALPGLHRGIAPLGPPAPVQPRLLGRGVGPPGHRPWPWSWGCSSPLPPLASGLGVWGSSSRPPPHRMTLFVFCYNFWLKDYFIWYEYS